MTAAPPPATRIGVMGLGAMGLPMAENLLTAHGALAITGRTRRYHALEERGATWCETPRALAARSDVVLAMLPDLPELEAVLAGEEGLVAGLDHPLVLLVGSTSSPTGVRALAADLHAQTRGLLHVVDCPVSGGEDGAVAGSLSIMMGGDEADTAVAARALAPCGTSVRLGPLGAGEVAKSCNQLVVSATMLALAEATVLAERSGIDPAELWDLLGRGYAGSNLLSSRRDKLVERDYRPSGVAKYMVKDLRFADDVAAATRTHPVLLPALRAAFDELVERGMGDDDLSVARKLVEDR
ncbi:2-hydroxy-3-oxopropionate reductase [Microbacterium oryzae]|uniref:NAD(P)-dependent oxidoreductase n=1 Tax=Microbacterium oryzae TaxID=743009 RepID=A0A6I6E4N5_9MICO|nr:NAD(P)-dependent oxidoreductase [Microbacterium oryzae]QGU27400.1 NAD(P)-dependent oxidoreductase [Microbacterium oryzae]